MASIFNPRSWFGDSPEQPDAPAQQLAAWKQQGLPGPAKGLVQRIRDKLGGYLGPQLSPQTPQERYIVDEKVASGPRNVVFPWFLPYFDNQTRETEQMRLAYRHMLASPIVKAALFGKLFGVCSLDLKILPADKKNPKDKAVAQHVQWMLTERLRDCVPGLIWAVLSGGLVDGYSVTEKVWALEDRGRYAGKYSLAKLKPKDVGFDLVLQTDEYRNVVAIQGLRYNAGLELSPSDFIVYRHLPMYDNPTGMSDLRAAYQSFWMLDTAYKLRMIHAEKNSMPMLVGSYQNATVKNSLEAALRLAKSQRWISIPEQCKVAALDIAGAAASVFKELIADIRHDVFLGIQYAVLQSLEGETTDGAGNSQVHASQADKCVRFLANSVESILNDRDCGLIKDMVDLNHVVSEYPRAQLSAVDPNDLAQEIAIDQGLHAMVDLSKDEIYERYGRTPPEDDDDRLAASAPPAGGAGGAGGAPPGGDKGGGGDNPLPFDDVNIRTAPPKLLPPGGGGATSDFRGRRFSEAWRAYLAADAG